MDIAEERAREAILRMDMVRDDLLLERYGGARYAGSVLIEFSKVPELVYMKTTNDAGFFSELGPRGDPCISRYHSFRKPVDGESDKFEFARPLTSEMLEITDRIVTELTGQVAEGR